MFYFNGPTPDLSLTCPRLSRPVRGCCFCCRPLYHYVAPVRNLFSNVSYFFLCWIDSVGKKKIWKRKEIGLPRSEIVFLLKNAIVRSGWVRTERWVGIFVDGGKKNRTFPEYRIILKIDEQQVTVEPSFDVPIQMVNFYLKIMATWSMFKSTLFTPQSERAAKIKQGNKLLIVSYEPAQHQSHLFPRQWSRIISESRVQSHHHNQRGQGMQPPRPTNPFAVITN